MTVRAENGTIAAAFDLSYTTLTPSQQRLFTLLGLHPGTETDDYDIDRSHREPQFPVPARAISS